VDVECLVEALVRAVRAQVDRREALEQRVIRRVEQQREDDHRQRKARDQERHEQP